MSKDTCEVKNCLSLQLRDNRLYAVTPTHHEISRTWSLNVQPSWSNLRPYQRCLFDRL